MPILLAAKPKYTKLKQTRSIKRSCNDTLQTTLVTERAISCGGLTERRTIDAVRLSKPELGGTREGGC
jgi:hypothetical protein